MREAFTACTAAATANPRSAEALTLLAHTELNRGHLSRAAELASKALLVDPNVADAYVIIGGVHQDSGQNAEAKAAYRRYLQLAPHGRYADDLRSIVNSL
jgi:Tfp pilus assembly protein PilF